MANTVAPKLTAVGSVFSVKTYNYGGSTKTNSATSIFSNYETIDYNINPEENKIAETLDFLHKAYSAVGSFLCSAAVSATAGLIEDVTDGLAMAGATIASKAARGLAWLFDKAGKDDIAEKLRKGSDTIESKTADYIAYDWSEAIYDDIVEAYGFDPEIAHGLAHTAGNMAGTFLAYTAITVATGGTGGAALAALGAASAAGSSAQKAFQNGATFNQAAINAGVSAVVGAASGAAMAGLGGVARGATSGLQVAGLTAAGAGLGAVTPTTQFATEYLTYGKDKYGLSAEGAKQYFNDSGAGLAIATGAAIGGVSTCAQGVQGVRNYKKLINSETYKNYDKTVHEKFEDNYKYDQTKKLGGDLDKYKDYEMSASEKAELQSRADKHVEQNGKNMHKQYGKGYAKEGISEEEFFDTIQNKKNPEQVYTEKYISKYNKQWKADEDGNVEVVSLKPGESYDDYVVGDGAIGRKDGEFVMPKDVAEKALKKSMVDGKVDPEILADELSLPRDTFKSGVVEVTQKVPKDQIQMPDSSRGGAAPGYWVPGGKTGGGTTEGVVPRLTQGSDGRWYNPDGQVVQNPQVVDYRYR